MTLMFIFAEVQTDCAAGYLNKSSSLHLRMAVLCLAMLLNKKFYSCVHSVHSAWFISIIRVNTPKYELEKYTCNRACVMYPSHED